jgi:hypothetical protein
MILVRLPAHIVDRKTLISPWINRSGSGHYDLNLTGVVGVDLACPPALVAADLSLSVKRVKAADTDIGASPTTAPLLLHAGDVI